MTGNIDAIDVGLAVYIVVVRHNIVDNNICLGPDLMAEGEIDNIIDDLHKQLEAARKKAKNILKKNKNKPLF